jgi:hypothetical protein
LEKERSARRADRSAWELMQRSQQSLTRTIQQSDTRVGEIETARQSDRKKFASLEKKMRDQLAERNGLLLSIWNHLSGFCGPEFARKYSFASSSNATEALDKSFITFSRNVNDAIKAIENLFSSFKGQIRELERTMWKEIQNIERALELRTKRVDHLEKVIGNNPRMMPDEQPSASRASSSRAGAKDEYFSKLKNENKLLRAEVQILRNSATGKVPERGSSHRVRADTASKGYSTTPDEGLQHVAVDPTVTVPSLPPTSSHGVLGNTSPTQNANRRASHHAGASFHSIQTSADVLHAGLVPSDHHMVDTGQSSSEQRWVHRLKELERRLKAEREARLLDRSGARKRIEESEAEKERLRQQLEHEMEMRASLEMNAGGMNHGVEEDRSLIDMA